MRAKDRRRRGGVRNRRATSPLRRGGLLFVLALICLGCWAASAQAYVYWSNLSLAEPNASTIGRANLDGSGVEQSFVTGVDYPLWLAADSSHLYWTAADGIGRANLDGSGTVAPFVAVPGSFYDAVAVGGSHVYWSDDVAGTIGRANLDGSGAEPDFIAGAGHPLGLTVDGSHVYWVNADGSSTETIARANLDGSGVEQGFISLPPSSSLCGVTVDGTHVYWSDESDEEIGRANLDGTGVEEGFIAAEAPCELALDGSHIYWASQANNAIGRANLDGTGVVQSLIPSAAGSYPTGVAADALPAPSPTPTPPTTPAPSSSSGSNPTPTPSPKAKGPDTILRSHPKAKLRTRKAKARARFTFTSDQPGADFECRLDKGRIKPCHSPQAYRVGPGRHTFQVEAVTAAGADPTPARFSFKVTKLKRHAKRHRGGRH